MTICHKHVLVSVDDVLTTNCHVVLCMMDMAECLKYLGHAANSIWCAVSCSDTMVGSVLASFLMASSVCVFIFFWSMD